MLREPQASLQAVMPEKHLAAFPVGRLELARAPEAEHFLIPGRARVNVTNGQPKVVNGSDHAVFTASMPRAASHTGLALHQAPGPRGLLPLDHLIRMPHDISGAPPADPKRRAAEPDDRSGWLAAESSAPASSRAFCGDARNTVAGVSAVSLTLCVLLWARPGAEDGLIAYEDQVLGLVSGHGGQVLQRTRGTGTGGQPLENQLPEFLSARALDAFMTDGRRRSLAGERDRVISKTEVIEVKLVPPVPGQ